MQKARICLTLVILTFLFFPAYVYAQKPEDSLEMPGIDQETKMFLKIEQDRLKGVISDKEAFMIKARLLFAPQTLEPGSAYALTPGSSIGREECGTGIYKELHRIFPQLTLEEKALLKAWSEDFRVILETREKEAVQKTP